MGRAAPSTSFSAFFLLPLLVACTGWQTDVELEPALAELSAAGFEFEVDVAFAKNRWSSCVDVSCAELALRGGRRTVELAPGAFDTPGRLRASLLEIWSRHKGGNTLRDRAAASLLVLREGPRVGVHERWILREAFHAYRRHWEGLDDAQRAVLADPETLPYP